MTFHPEDEFGERLKKAKETYEQEMELVDKQKVKLDNIMEELRAATNIPEDIMSLLDSLALILYRVGVNRVEIKQNQIEMYQWFDLKNKQIDRLSEQLAGLDKKR